MKLSDITLYILLTTQPQTVLSATKQRALLLKQELHAGKVQLIYAAYVM